MPGKGKAAVFLLNLLQDVNVLRGIVYLTARETEAAITLLVSRGFLKRDRQKIWQREVARMAAATGASMYLYGSAAEACEVIRDGSGILFAGSESNLRAHWETGDVFRAAPPGYLRVTLQHGLECVGFLQSRDHVTSHGRNISFAADVVCGWFEPELLTSLTASERGKLYVTGPPSLLQRPTRGRTSGASRGGLVCENLHSVRLSASGDHQKPFLDTFFDFCAKLRDRGEWVTLRPHPGGQYVLKNNVPLPANVRLEMRPIFDVNFTDYRFGISAPSTIIMDMVLAGIPVALWRDSAHVIDTSNYEGLTEISTLDDWLAFERDVRIRPEMILQQQEEFLRRLSMPREPAEVYRRFARLVVAGLEGLREWPTSPTPSQRAKGAAAAASVRPLALSGDVLVEARA